MVGHDEILDGLRSRSGSDSPSPFLRYSIFMRRISGVLAVFIDRALREKHRIDEQQARRHRQSAASFIGSRVSVEAAGLYVSASS